MSKTSARKKRKISDEAVVEMILQLCTAVAPNGQVKPEEVAMELYPEEWQSLLKRVRLVARQLAEVGHIFIIRKGEIADPADFKGIYRLRINPDFLSDE